MGKIGIALPDINIWKECVRVFKVRDFSYDAPRSDVHSRMCLMLKKLVLELTLHLLLRLRTYASKMMNIGKMVDKRLGE